MSNYLKIFSNGMAHFTRNLPPVKERTVVQIPVKRTSLSDALATLAVFGNVQITEPPSYPVTDADKVLTVNPDNVTSDLATKLSGARVEVEERGGATTKGTLFGKQPYEERVGEAVIERYRLAIYDEANTFRCFDDTDVKGIKFLEPTVQQEIKKALERNFSTINPESTNVSMTLAPLPDTDNSQPVLYQLTIPFSAWQPVYQLRLNNGGCELECSAKVDNPTDEDLNDYIVSVVTGEPNTFETDLGDVRKPKRQRINIISDTATGAVGAQDVLPAWQTESVNAFGDAIEDDEGGGATAAGARAFSASSSSRAKGGVRPQSLMAACAAPVAARAQGDSAVASEVGDFAVYTSKNPVNIGRKRSTVIPLFQSKAEGSVFLFYKETPPLGFVGAWDRTRPFRAVKFKNSTEYSLGKGSCTVYNEETYQGQVVLEATKPGEERTLPHARENGVRVFVNPAGSNGGTTSDRRARIEIVKGVIVIDNVKTHETVYRFVNSKAEAFVLDIEHERKIGDGRTTFEVKGNSGPHAVLDNGVRIPCKLPGKGQLEVRVWETEPVSQSVVLYNNPVNYFPWFLRTIVQCDNPPKKLVTSKKVVNVIDLYEKLLKAQEAVQEAEQEVQVLGREQARKMELVKSGGSGSQVDAWRQELAVNEKEIKAQEREKVPNLRKAVKVAEDALTEALKALTVSWVDGENGEERQ